MDHGIFVPIVLFGVIAYIVKIAAENRTRRILIEKGEINENLKYLFADKLAYAVPSSLKWGMVLIAVGLAFFISRAVNLGMDDETALFALMFLFGGIALVIYYFIGTRMLKNQKEN
ncbi:hypothetical protein JXA02_05415 [candidate division KSB1 bacterium]|nr:hypothetical protein [candidate division KSB1 bacterium]RQW08055.1 MAG: hypothetical protein EH222_06210 [candidate division KSB1 bacterium]